MNWTIIIIETIVLTLAFTAMILIPLVKNPVWWIADYPEDIQEEYFKTHERIPSKFFSPTVLLKKGMALLIALALLLLVAKLAGAYDFWSALAVGYGIWLFIDWYDCFFLDWVLFANLKKVRLPGTEHMDEAYHQKKYHFIQSCWGMLSASSLASSERDYIHGYFAKKKTVYLYGKTRESIEEMVVLCDIVGSTIHSAVYRQQKLRSTECPKNGFGDFGQCCAKPLGEPQHLVPIAFVADACAACCIQKQGQDATGGILPG